MSKSSFWIICVVAFLSGPVVLPAAERPAKATTAARDAKSGAKIDVNTADEATLQTLPGIGPATAREIVEARPFSSVSDLERVPGIGPARMADLRDRVTVSRSTRKAAGTERAVTRRQDADTPARTGSSREETSARDRRTSAPAASEPRAHAGGKVDVNTADISTLETLPGVGPATAQAIVAARPFNSVDDLIRVSGIGEERLKDLRAHVTVSRPRVEKAPQTRSARDADRSARPSASSPPSSRDGTRANEPTGRTTTSASQAQGKINLNTATREELEALPEIGPVKAQAIIEARPFRSIEEVMRVSGIKEATFEAIKDQITVR